MKKIKKSLVGVNSTEIYVKEIEAMVDKHTHTHTDSIPLNSFTHFGSHLVNETLYKFPGFPHMVLYVCSSLFYVPQFV